MLKAIGERLGQCGLELHPKKTRIVYCKDYRRRGKHEHISFDFLGYTFRPRQAKSRWGKNFTGFLPAISGQAATAIRATIRRWRISTSRTHQHLGDIARLAQLLWPVQPGLLCGAFRALFQPDPDWMGATEV